jgi:hypothetical protein
MESHDDSPFQESSNNLNLRTRLEMLCQMSPPFFRAVCDMFIPSPEHRSDEQLMADLVKAFQTFPPDFTERVTKFFAIWNAVQKHVSSHLPGYSRYTKFANAVSDLLADEHTASKVYDIVTRAVIEIWNLTGQSAEAFAKQTRLWLPAALEELEAAEEIMKRG